jgi:glycosyltransferase involved in cell wall biosynthesis
MTRPGRPRIAVIAASLDIVGGHGVQALALAEGLGRDGFDVELIPVNPRFPAGLSWVRRCSYARTFLNEALFVPSLRALRRADVAHVFSAAYWSFLLGPAPAITTARSLGKRVVLNYHSGEAEDHLARWGALVHPWLRRADAIVVPSEYLREVLLRHGYRADVIPNVVDTTRFGFRERAPLRPCLLSTRNLEPHYGVSETLEAFTLVKRRYPDATLAVAGQGSEEGRLRRLAAQLGDGGIQFLGRVEPAEMPALYARHDIFVNASHVDNQPVSILEAFAAGLPVVSTGTGDIAAMVRTGESGRLVPGGDPSAMASAVVGLLENPEASRLMARRARVVAEAHTWPRVRQAWAAVYAGEAGAAA